MPARCGLEPGSYALVTLHRPANVDSAEALAGIVGVIAEMQELLPVVFPVHPRTRARLQAAGLWGRLEGMPGVRLLDPLGYLEFLGLMAGARLVLTDSGGIQEETTILGVPCLTARPNTERPATIREGTNQLVGTDPEGILAAVRRTLASGGRPGRAPELWDGHAAERVVDVLWACYNGKGG
jgi:UDP-N-acetylglucosamine 2-epimerase (non-hydrolysing)